MKSLHKLTLLITIFLLTALVIPGTALAASPSTGSAEKLGDQFVFGGSYTLPRGDTLEGNLFVFGGNATLSEGSTVTGNIILLGGNLDISSEVDGNIYASGGNIRLRSSTVVHGSLARAGTNLDQAPGSRVEGGITNETGVPFWFTFPNMSFPNRMNIPVITYRFSPAFNILWFLFRVFVLAALAMLVAMIWPKQTERTASAIVTQPVISGGLGLLTAIIAPLIMIVLTITIILIPVSLLLVLALGVMALFGWIALGTEIGHRFAHVFKVEWHPAISAGVGTFAMTFILSGINEVIWCCGAPLIILVGLIGLGAVMLTRFGTQDYMGRMTPPPAPIQPIPVPPASPAEVVQPNLETSVAPETPPTPKDEEKTIIEPDKKQP